MKNIIPNKISGLPASPKLSNSAAIWAKDGFNEKLKSGSSSKDAITHLRRSPFFNDHWIV